MELLFFTKNMKKGIILLAIGKNKAYGNFCANMAMSLKFHNPDVPIHLIHEEDTVKHLRNDYRQFFDVMTVIEHTDAYRTVTSRKGRTEHTEEKLSPARAKLSLFKYLEFDENIYFDIDGCCIGDVTRIYDAAKGKDYLTQVVGYASIHAESFPEMQWAKPANIKEHYNITEDITLPAINSSFQYIRKSEGAKKLYNKACENYINAMPAEKRWITWGGKNNNDLYSGQPDELYMNIALAQLGIDPKIKAPEFPVYFRTRNEYGKPDKLTELAQKHAVLGLYGDKTFNHNSIYKHYNNTVHQASLKLLNRSIQFKCELLMESKWVNNRK